MISIMPQLKYCYSWIVKFTVLLKHKNSEVIIFWLTNYSKKQAEKASLLYLLRQKGEKGVWLWYVFDLLASYFFLTMQ